MLPLRSQRVRVVSREKAAAPSPDKRATVVKDWAEAATSVAKALLFFGTIAIVVAITATMLWRDRHTRRVEVTVDVEADRALRAMGSRIDLRQTFVDVLNERIRGVEQIFALSYTQLLDTRDAPDVSFKPFGLDASTGEVEKIVRSVFGSDAPAVVRIELACQGGKCDDARRDVVLLVTVQDGSGSERRALPVGGTVDGLHRRLRAAMGGAADLLLERDQPLIAAVYDLNASQLHPFPDDRSRDLQRAMASALKLRDAKGEPTCIANLVISGSLLLRDTWEDGLAIAQRAGSVGNRVCDVHAATGVVYLMPRYLCNPDAGTRTAALDVATKAEGLARAHDRSGLDALVADRIPAAGLVLSGMQLLAAPDMAAARVAVCEQARAASGPSNRIPGYVVETLEKLERDLPPHARQFQAPGLLQGVVALEEFGIPQDDLAGRYRAALATMRAIERYLPNTPLPRNLFYLRGRVATEIAETAIDATALPPASRRALMKDFGANTDDDRMLLAALRSLAVARLVEARVDYQNALSADSGPAISGQPSDVALAAALGDANLALGDNLGAQDEFARAVDAFLDSDAQVDRVVPLAETIGRLSLVDQRNGNCSGVGLKSVWADPRPARLGFDAATWCALGGPSAAGRPGLTGLLAALAAPVVVACGPLQLVTGLDPFAAVRWLRCARANGPSRPKVAEAVLGGRNGTAMRFTLEDALDVAPRSGP